MSIPYFKPNTERLWRNIEALAEIREADFGGWTRRAFTPRYAEGRLLVRRLMEEAGLAVRRDAAANLLGELTGTRPYGEDSVSPGRTA